MAKPARDSFGPASSEPAGAASGPASSVRERLRVFISYSRDDLDFADQLAAALDLSGFECFIDREGISGGEDWKRRLGNLISEADTVIFVLSPSSARSETCNWEVEEAARLNKRILPANCRPLESVNPPPRLHDLNYIFFYQEPKVPGSGFGTGLAKLVTALNTDFDWLREHTRYLQRAIEWDKGGRPANRLLSGNDILEARVWAAGRPKSAPEPTALHLDFIRASEEEEAARSSAQRQQVEAMAATQAEREAALHDREEALNRAADAQRRRATIRNIAVVVGIFAAGVTWWGWNAEWNRRELLEENIVTKLLNFEQAKQFSNSARQALFAKEFPKALAAAERAHGLAPDELTIENNRAHALMFMDRGDQAKALYLTHKGQPVFGLDDKLWEQVIADDFAELRKAGLTHPMMADIERELGVSPDGNADMGQR